MELTKGVNTAVYIIDVCVEVLPYELKNVELMELDVEVAVGCALERLFAAVDIKDVRIHPAHPEVERDWDSLLPGN